MRNRVDLGALDSGSVSLYEVYNTSHRSLLVLAKDHETARSIAWSAAHIYHTDNGLNSEDRNVYEVRSRPSHGTLHDHWTTLQAAISQRLQGTVQLADGRVIVGNTEVNP